MSSKTLTKRFKTAEEERQFQLDWAASAPVRKTLNEVLDEKIAYVRRKRLDKENYKNPNYAVEQAALNERERCYEELKDLINS